MANITELTSEYLKSNFIQETQEDLLNSMFLLDAFGVQDWEDQLTLIISLTDKVEQDDVRDLFVEKLERFMREVLDEHKITISEEQTPTLWELNELCHFVYLVQDLEDMEFISYRLHTDLPPKRIFVQIASYLSQLTDFRLMEIIEDVHPDLIESLKQMAHDKEKAPDAITGVNRWKRDWDIFLSFINKLPCVGIQISSKGFGLLPFLQLHNLAGVNWEFKVSQAQLSHSYPQLALDVLSFILYTEEGSQAPLLVFDKYMGQVLQKTEVVSKLRPVLVTMIGDYTLHKNVCLQASQQQSEVVA